MKYKYIYGPVPSWRLGSSLGIDPLSQDEKICTFDCIYCQLGDTRIFDNKRKKYIETSNIIQELNSLPLIKIDYITFSGSGEPTLAENLGQMINEIKKIRREKIAVLTNSSLINREDVQKDLSNADLVVVKLDASSQKNFEMVNRPIEGIEIDNIIKGIKEFKSRYHGKLALQIMFMDQNKEYAKEIAQVAEEINPVEVQINTPLRPCKAKPLPKEEIDAIKKYFKSLNTVTVYESEKKKVEPVSEEDTLKRRGKTLKFL